MRHLHNHVCLCTSGAVQIIQRLLGRFGWGALGRIFRPNDRARLHGLIDRGCRRRKIGPDVQAERFSPKHPPPTNITSNSLNYWSSSCKSLSDLIVEVSSHPTLKGFCRFLGFLGFVVFFCFLGGSVSPSPMTSWCSWSGLRPPPGTRARQGLGSTCTGCRSEACHRVVLGLPFWTPGRHASMFR